MAKSFTQYQLDGLIELAQKGDWEAMAQLYRHFLEPLYRFCYWQLQDQAQAEDVTSATLMVMIESLPKYQKKGSFKSWLFSIAKRQVFRQLRIKYSEVVATQILELIPDEPALIDTLNQQVRQKYLKNLLAKLGQPHRQILELRFLQNYSVKQTAAQLNLTPNQVKVYTNRAKHKLQQAQQEEHEGSTKH